MRFLAPKLHSTRLAPGSKECFHSLTCEQHQPGKSSLITNALGLEPANENMSNSAIQPVEQIAEGNFPVRGVFHLPANPSGDGLILTHGAGANCESPLLVAIATEFCADGITVLRCDLPFRQMRQHGPPSRGSAEKDQRGLRAAVAVMRARVSGRIFLGGHSYGGRQASMLAASEPGLADALLLLSYPLHPPKQPDQLRIAHFPTLRTPALFVLGSRDVSGSVEEMTAALKLIPAANELLIIGGPGHELLNRRNCEELPRLVVNKFHSFTCRMAQLLPQ